MEKNGKGVRGVAFRMGSWVGRIWRKVVAGWKEITGEAWWERYQVLQGDLIRSGVERREKIEEERLREWGMEKRLRAEGNRQRWFLSEFGQECHRKWGAAAKVRRDIEAMKAAERKNRREEMGRRMGGIPGVIPDYYPFGMWQQRELNRFEGMSFMDRKDVELGMAIASIPATWTEEIYDVSRESKKSGRNSIGPVVCERCGWTYEPGKGHLCMYPVRTFKGLGKPVTGRPAGAGW